MTFENVEHLKSVGLDVSAFGQLSYVEKDREYPRSQEVAEACFFLGADAIRVPSARHTSSTNLIIFCEQDSGLTKAILKNHGLINWKTP